MSLRSFPDCHPLVVDDDPNFILILRRSLAKLGVPLSQVRSCADGDEAIRVLSDRWMPSFVLLDLKMPRRSGLEVLEWIRFSKPLETFPIFMLTSGDRPEDVARAFELGVGSYFLKPMEIPALEGILESILGYWNSRSHSCILRGSIEPPRPSPKSDERTERG